MTCDALRFRRQPRGLHIWRGSGNRGELLGPVTMHRVGRDGLWFVHINRQFRWPILKELKAITKIDPMMFWNEPPIEPPKATTPKHVGRNQSEAKEGSEIRG